MNIYQVSSRTRLKIIKKLQLACFNCDWSEANCDIHHIVPRSKGGTNDHTNLTILCPNCHRLAHIGSLTSFKTLDEVVGDRWKAFYKKSRSFNKEALEKSLDTRRKKHHHRMMCLVQMIKQSDIDFMKRGWVARVSETFSIKHQHVSRIIKKYDPVFYDTIKGR